MFKTILRGLVVLCFFAAPVVSAERLKRYIVHKLCSELPEGPFAIVYMHTTVQKEDNSPGITILRWIYEDLPSHFKDRLKVVYFVHPGLRSRLVFATLGRFFLSGGWVNFRFCSTQKKLTKLFGEVLDYGQIYRRFAYSIILCFRSIYTICMIGWD